MRFLFDFEPGCLNCGRTIVTEEQLAAATEDAERYIVRGMQEPHHTFTDPEKVMTARQASITKAHRAQNDMQRARGGKYA